MKPMFDRMDDRHVYEVKIYESYIKNGNFSLTEEQRADAYRLYLKAKA